MTAPTNSPADLDLPSTDTCPACEGNPPTGPEGGSTPCDRPAQVRVRYYHVTNQSPECHAGVSFLLCYEHFAESILSHQAYFRQHRNRQIVCVRCHETITCIHDVMGKPVPL